MTSTPTALASLLLASLCTSAAAFQPFITDDTGTQGQGGKQMEVSHVEAQARFDSDTTRTRSLPLVFTVGITDTLDLHVDLTPTDIQSGPTSSSGWGNNAVGAKWRFLEHAESRTSLAIKPEIRFPVGAAQESDGLGTGATSYGLGLVLTKETDFGVLHVNWMSAIDRYADARPDTRTQRLSIAPVWNVGETWRIGMDLGYVTATSGPQTTNTRLVQLGAIHSPSKDLDLAVGVLRGVDDTTSPTTTTTTTLGLTWRFR